MAYEYHGSWSGPGPIAPYAWVEQVAAFAVSQIPPEKVLLGLAAYGFDWNTTSGGARYLGWPEAAALGERYGVPIALDPTTRSETLRYRAPSGEPPPLPAAPPAPAHEMTHRRPLACSVAEPPSGATPTPRPGPARTRCRTTKSGWKGARARRRACRWPTATGTGGVAMWRLGHEDPTLWTVVERWRRGGP